VVHTDDAATAAGVQSSRGALRLTSGTLIRLDAGTDVRFESASRLDLLAGALYADTDAAPSALVIDTLAGTVSDVGTRFIARVVEGSEPADDAPRHAAAPGLVVLVRDGRVSIETGGGSETAGAGERLLVRGDGAVEHRSVRTWGREWDWVLDAAPRFDVAGRSIAEILDWVSRETGWTVRYEDAALGEAARSMMVQASRSEPSTLRADQAAFVLLPGANLEGELDAAGVLTVRRR